MPQISILMSVKNEGESLKESIQKVIDQSFTDFELLIFNENLSKERISLIMSFDDPRICLLKNNANSLDSTIRGEFVVFMDTNTIIHSEYLRILLKRMKLNSGITICSSWIRLLKGDTSISQNQLLDKVIATPVLCFLRNELFIWSSFMVKKSFLIENKLKSYNLQEFEYLELWFKIAKYGGQFFIEPQYLSNYIFLEKKETSREEDDIKKRLINIKKEMIFYLLEEVDYTQKLKKLYYLMEKLEEEKLLTSDNMIQFFIGILIKKSNTGVSDTILKNM